MKAYVCRVRYISWTTRKGAAYFEDLKEVPDLAVASVNARDDAFKIRKALRDLTEPELIFLVLHKFLDGVQTKKNMRQCL